MVLNFIEKRDGTIARFNGEKIKTAIEKAAQDALIDQSIDPVYSGVIQELNQRYNNGRKPKIRDIEEIIIRKASELGFPNLSEQYESYRDHRIEAHEKLRILSQVESSSNTTDTNLLIASESNEMESPWDRLRIVKQLENEGGLERELAIHVAKRVENDVLDLYNRGTRSLHTDDIRSLVDLELRQLGLEEIRRTQTSFSIPGNDIKGLVFSASRENANVPQNNPEAVNAGIAGLISKKWALANIYSQEVADAHNNGIVHVHDLDYPVRVYCSAHSLAYLLRFGLGSLLANLEAKSNPPRSAAVLSQHVQTFLASMQANYAGALGFGYVNIIYAGLLNRPVEVVRGRLGDREFSLESRDLEKLLESEVWTTNPNDDSKPYFKEECRRYEMRTVPSREQKQVAQNLIFAGSQNAFSRGGQTLFIDFNLHADVPHYMKGVPAMGPGGDYIVLMPDGEAKFIRNVPRFQDLDDFRNPRNGDAFDEGLIGEFAGGHIVTYEDLEPTAQEFAKVMLEVWREGYKDGRPFHFPKCDLHIDARTFEQSGAKKVFDKAVEVAAENGSVYFMFDRGTDAVLAQCCRLKEKVTDPEMLKYPERLRFCGFQNVTVNLAQAAYKGKDFKGTLREIDIAMNIALDAHKQKAAFIQRLLDTDGSPLRSLGKPSDDGMPYIDLKKATYIIGNIALDEAVKFLTGQQLHESENAYVTGLEIIGHMYRRIQEFRERTGLKFTIEETPAESATRRFAKVDLRNYPTEAASVIRNKEEPAYTNSIHYAPGAPVGLIDRIVGQSKFHTMIESGAIVHAWVGEKRPSKKFIAMTVKNTLEQTNCSQLVFSPTYTECDSCGNIMQGEKSLCTNSECRNHSSDTLDKDKGVYPVTRIVGYNSRIKNWNKSQIGIYEERKAAEELYAGGNGAEMPWLYNPSHGDQLSVLQFGKEGCGTCSNLEENVRKTLVKTPDVDYRVIKLNERDPKDLALAAMYDVPLDTVPTLVVAGKNGYWKQTTVYGTGRSQLIKPKDIKTAIQERIGDYETK